MTEIPVTMYIQGVSGVSWFFDGETESCSLLVDRTVEDGQRKGCLDRAEVGVTSSPLPDFGSELFLEVTSSFRGSLYADQSEPL